MPTLWGQQLSREALLQRLDAYLCEIKESQIRDGLHILGRSPQGRQRTDTLVALARFPGGKGAGQGSRQGSRVGLACTQRQRCCRPGGRGVPEWRDA